ncbi:MAG: type II toxin-antitoxin system VapC family toxin [Rhodospirillaceae bacterium]|nr:type II toxin-antitoxin system VapC family toxin [Rhodospirillaceae bacterium]
MTVLLDTNVLSELRRSDRANARVAAWAVSIQPSDMFLSAITMLEIETGVLLLQRRDKQQAGILRAWIDEEVLPTFEGRILAVDTAVAQRCAQLQIPDRRPHLDALIGATALVHRLKLATRNVTDFEGLGLELINPWA